MSVEEDSGGPASPPVQEMTKQSRQHKRRWPARRAGRKLWGDWPVSSLLGPRAQAGRRYRLPLAVSGFLPVSHTVLSFLGCMEFKQVFYLVPLIIVLSTLIVSSCFLKHTLRFGQGFPIPRFLQVRLAGSPRLSDSAGQPN